jgi:hypothetical protein
MFWHLRGEMLLCRVRLELQNSNYKPLHLNVLTADAMIARRILAQQQREAACGNLRKNPEKLIMFMSGRSPADSSHPGVS